ncbi:MAG: polyprenyl synthetase family protein [Spirochaetales bacterium]|nr:polyprenyl synthetase family protein [Spirochaetales bacterium]MCF7939340.1 polyprenyl synthetase family protein [Spirochaetales bacterium]
MTADFTSRLADIEARLAEAFPPSPDGAWIASALGPIHSAYSSEQAAGLHRAGWELLERGGKRWRPLLMLLSAELIAEAESGGGGGPQLPPGAAYNRALFLSPVVELAHNGTLIVDDIEDEARQRRGRPAVHMIHGTDVAINAGNYLYFAAASFIDAFPPDAESGRRNDQSVFQSRLYRRFLQEMRRVHAGQDLDIRWHREASVLPGRNEYEQMCRFKTGSLAGMAAAFGAISAEADRKTEEQLAGFAEELGVAFQFLDDAKNLSAGNPGKMRGDDIVEGKKSLPLILHLQSRPEDHDRMVALIRKAGSYTGEAGVKESAAAPPEPVLEAIGLMEDSGSIDQARELGLDRLDQAAGLLFSGFSGIKALGLIQALIDEFRRALV